MNIFHADQAAWLAQVEEPIVDPSREIIDPHHHLWPDMRGDVYNIDEFAIDTSCGHNVIGTVYMECGTSYRQDGPEHLRSLGETEYVQAQAARVHRESLGAPILGMVGSADLSNAATLCESLDAHRDLAGDFFKGIRQAGASARDADREHLLIPGTAPADLYQQEAFQNGVRELGRRGLSYDTWHYHYQNRDFLALARACPDTILVLDHFGTPLGVGPFSGQHDVIFKTWQEDMRALSTCPNVYLKLGGLAMPDNGFAWHLADSPPTSQDFVSAQGRWYRHAIECFGAHRCMFESNFPVDRMSVSYAVLFNALKMISSNASEDEKNHLFSGTARRVYNLGS